MRRDPLTGIWTQDTAGESVPCAMANAMEHTYAMQNSLPTRLSRLVELVERQRAEALEEAERLNARFNQLAVAYTKLEQTCDIQAAELADARIVLAKLESENAELLEVLRAKSEAVSPEQDI